MDNLEKVREKISALLKKNTENGASEAEANAAMMYAQKLMEQYGVTLKDLKENTTSNDFVHRRANAGDKNVDAIDKLLCNAIAFYTDTKVWIHSEVKHENMIVFLGYSIDVELALYIREVCKRAIETEWGIFSSALPKGSRAKDRKPFIIGMAIRLSKRLKELKQENIIKTSGTELVVLKTDLVIQEFSRVTKDASSVNVGLGNINGSKSANTAMSAGYIAAEKVRFNREVHDVSVGGVKRISK